MTAAPGWLVWTALWIVYLVLGGIFTIGGIVLWIRAFRAPAEA